MSEIDLLCRNCGGNLNMNDSGNVIVDDDEYEHLDCPDPELLAHEKALEWSFDRLLALMETIGNVARLPSDTHIQALIDEYNKTMPGLHQVAAALRASDGR